MTEPTMGTPLYPTPRSYAFYLQESRKLIDDADPDNPHYSLSGDSSDYAWGTSYVMTALYTAYRVTKDADYLDMYATVCHNLLSTLADNDGDGFLGWGTGEYSGGSYDEFAVHTGFVAKGLADFVLLVQSDPAIANRAAPEGTLGELAGKVRHAVDAHLIPAFERDFSKAFGIYMNRPGSGNYSGATGEYSLPHNQYLAMSTALYTMALVSPEKANFYTARADTQTSVFKGWIRHKDDGFINWSYDNSFHKGDHDHVIAEDFSHAMMDYQAAIEAYHRGNVFSWEEISLFADNLTNNMFNGDYDNVKISYAVSGGRYADYSGEPYLYNILLSPFGEAVWPVCEAGWGGRTTDAAYLLAWHPDAPAPESFSLTAPANGADTVNPRQAVFMWMPSKNAADYTLEISKTADFAQLVVERPYIAAVGAFVDILEPHTKYFWRVQARNAAGETVTSDVLSFTTGEKDAFEPKILTFSYKAGDLALTEGQTMRVYLHRTLMAEVPLTAGEDWQEFSLDLTEAIGYSNTAGIKISLYKPGADAEESVLYIDDVALSGSIEPAVDFSAEVGYIWGAPIWYARRSQSRIEDGVLLLRTPSQDEVKIFKQYISREVKANESFFDIGFSFSK
jgi:hypothetical protein